MTFDRSRGLVGRFGGWTGKVRVDETWTLGSGHWSRLDLPGPPARNHTSFTYDSRRRQVCCMVVTTGKTCLVIRGSGMVSGGI